MGAVAFEQLARGQGAKEVREPGANGVQKAAPQQKREAKNEAGRKKVSTTRADPSFL